MIRRAFEREVEYLWSRLARAAVGHEPLGALWSRDGDPRVTRIVQAAAYAFARAKERLDDDLPALSHALVAGALPEVLRPAPSVTVMQFRDARDGARRAHVYESQDFDSRLVDEVPCIFRTSWPVSRIGADLTSAEIRTRESGIQTLVLRLALRGTTPIAVAFSDVLPVFVDTDAPGRALDIVHALCLGTGAIRVRSLGERGQELAVRELHSITRACSALASPFRLAQGPTDRFESGTALRSFFSSPEVFAFFELRGFEAAYAAQPAGTRQLELWIPLAGSLANTDVRQSFRLQCTPAVNVFEASCGPIAVHRTGPCGRLAVRGTAEREIFHVNEAVIRPDRDPENVTFVRLWDTFHSRPYREGDVFLRFDRRPPLNHGAVEFHAVLFRPDDGQELPRGTLDVRVLATDGARTDRLLKGDIAHTNDSLEIANITRVSRAYGPSLNERLPWRANAYARMPLSRFATPGSIAAYLDLLDVTGTRRSTQRGDAGAAGIARVSRAPSKRVRGDEVLAGDDFELALDEKTFGGAGATWIIGELLARAFAERADILRYTHSRLTNRRGETLADYGVRPGHRVPAPFG